ncbi:MAG: Trx7/PDZ domain-containing (seleno)protein [Aureliella sp.]
MKSLWMTLVLYAVSACAFADDADALKKRLQDLNGQNADHWIYNDIPAGFAEAQRTGKPLFITFRCVPCVDCLGFDGEVADGNGAIKQLASEAFVGVRQVEMKGVDLTQFQFDHDLNWAGMFLNADGTIYARYGTQSSDGADAFNSVEGLLATMNRVLELHEEYPNNKHLFVGKKPDQKPWKTAKGIPTLHPNLRKEAQTSRTHCIHCHNIHDAEHDLWVRDGVMSKDKLWRYPFPDNLGISLSVRDGRTVDAVKAGSVAAKAGIVAGKVVNQVNGQAISSVADFQWVLHGLPNRAGETITVTFDDDHEATLKTNENWKETDISWRGSLFSLSPKLRIWMPALKSSELSKHNLSPGTTALMIKWINRGKPAGKAAVGAGLKQGDIILKAEGRPVPDSDQQFHAWVKMNYQSGQTLPLTVMRNGNEIEIELPLVE